MKGLKHIAVKEETWRKLVALKVALGLNSLDAVLEYLIDRIHVIEKIKGELCRDYAGASGTLAAWQKILDKLFPNPTEKAIAYTLLKKSGESLILPEEVCQSS